VISQYCELGVKKEVKTDKAANRHSPTTKKLEEKVVA